MKEDVGNSLSVWPTVTLEGVLSNSIQFNSKTLIEL